MFVKFSRSDQSGAAFDAALYGAVRLRIFLLPVAFRRRNGVFGTVAALDSECSVRRGNWAARGMASARVYGFRDAVPVATRIARDQLSCDERERSRQSKRNSELAHGSGGTGMVSSGLVACVVVRRMRVLLLMYACLEYAVHRSFAHRHLCCETAHVLTYSITPSILHCPEPGCAWRFVSGSVEHGGHVCRPGNLLRRAVCV